MEHPLGPEEVSIHSLIDVARMEEKSKEDPGAVSKVPPISTFIEAKSRMPKLEALKTIALLDILSPPLSDIGRQMSARGSPQ